MRKFLSYTLPFIVSFFALVPVIQFYLLPPPFNFWPMMIVLTAFLGMLICFLDTNVFIKAISVLSFAICFFSSSPYLSFNQYCSIVACCYLYIGLARMGSYDLMFKCLYSVLIVNSIMLGVQLLNNDTLLNFGMTSIASYGVIGQHMQMGSFSVVLAACLSIIHPAFWLFPIVVGLICNSAWTIFCAYAGILLSARTWKVRVIAIVVFALAIMVVVNGNKVQQAFGGESGRIMIWTESIRLLNERPLTGWGPGMYKYIFPALSGVTGVPWKTAHNDFIQMAFELGYPLFALLMIGWLWVLIKMKRKKQTVFVVGFIVISLDMLVHFPARMIQCVPLIIFFFAFHDGLLRRK